MATKPRFDTEPMPTEVRRVDSDGRRVHNGRLVGDEPQMRDLLKQLASEGGDLVRSEIALAKLEMRDMAQDLAMQSAKLGGAIAFALTGALALAAAAIIALGNALGGAYALSALIVGVVVLLIGGVLAWSGVQGLKNPPKPEQTAETMRENRDWAAREVRQFKEEIRS
jgi:uncharacterized membrane protein YqjE